jgi:hypothetical protein
MGDEVYLSAKPVETTWIRWLGYVLTWGNEPVHACLFWQYEDGCYKAELTSDKPIANAKVVGKGDGYTIQITKVPQTEGTIVKGADKYTVEGAVRLYASTAKGYLDGSNERDFYSSPQGYGGPMYDVYTCNTFTSWALAQSCLIPPSKPSRGAIGWGVKPKFPGPKMD